MHIQDKNDNRPQVRQQKSKTNWHSLLQAYNCSMKSPVHGPTFRNVDLLYAWVMKFNRPPLTEAKQRNCDTLNRLPWHTEIFSKRRKIYSCCVKTLRFSGIPGWGGASPTPRRDLLPSLSPPRPEPKSRRRGSGARARYVDAVGVTGIASRPFG